jgi:acyl-homoserine lactone acylase PvdQ
MLSAGELPRRDPRVDPRLPTLGTGGYEWRGILPSRKLPQQVNPAGGTLLNWNNSPAPGFGAADDNWSYGSLHRVSLLRNQIARHPKHDLASVTSAMNAAATQDLRSTALTPTLSTLLRGGPAPSARAQLMLEKLEAWRVNGSSRLDRDGDGAMDSGAAPVIMDTFYPRLLDAVMGGALGPQLADLKSLEGSNNFTGSGFTGGGINYIDKDLRQLLGARFKHPFRTRFCGGGDVNACRAAVWGALDSAGEALETAQGSASPDAWRSDAAKERISFVPGLLTTKIAYTNRPSGIQQVISFKGHRSRRR